VVVLGQLVQMAQSGGKLGVSAQGSSGFQNAGRAFHG
jgi:hypothetical protein